MLLDLQRVFCLQVYKIRFFLIFTSFIPGTILDFVIIVPGSLRFFFLLISTLKHFL